MPSPEGYAVAMLIAAVGIDIDTEYGLEESMAYAYDLQGFFNPYALQKCHLRNI